MGAEKMSEDNVVDFKQPELVGETVLNHSKDIGKIALALSKAQALISHAHKDSTNPFFKSNYADLASCWDAVRKPLSDNELAVIQTHSVSDKGEVVLTTLLVHSSGQFFKGILSIRPTKNDPQMYVAATTYGRRCGLSAMVGISPAEDDGNGISGKASTTKTKTKSSKSTKESTKSKQPVESDDDDF